MSINSAIGGAMLNAAHGALLGRALGDLQDQLDDERAWRLRAEATAHALRAKVNAQDIYIRALRAAQEP